MFKLGLLRWGLAAALILGLSTVMLLDFGQTVEGEVEFLCRGFGKVDGKWVEVPKGSAPVYENLGEVLLLPEKNAQALGYKTRPLPKLYDEDRRKFVLYSIRHLPGGWQEHMEDAGREHIFRATINKDGRFLIEDVPAGYHVLYFHKLAYSPEYMHSYSRPCLVWVKRGKMTYVHFTHPQHCLATNYGEFMD